ncbi:MAG: (Fe-S)-binding protein [Promethearchaeota archaeon]|nr:MAG: (Fe-S)-binding protein [Candidatus Lokiarchaeota archaeon]
MTKLIYFGCLSSGKYKDTCENAKKIIQFLDNEYVVIEDPPCCGSLAHQVATEEKVREHVRMVNDWFKSNDVTDLVTICAGCYNYLTRYYPEYLGSEFKINVMHLLQFMDTPENLKKLNLKYEGTKKLKVYYHDACHLKNATDPIIEEARDIINSIDGKIQLGEMENTRINALCCGAGGGVYSIFKENSDYNAKLIFDQMRMSKALLTACPFCYTAFKRIKDENNIKTPVIKFEDFILRLMEGVDPVNV